MSSLSMSVLILLFPAISPGEIVTKEIAYTLDSTVFKGLLVYDNGQAKSKKPGVLVVHEWWGLNDFAKSKAKQLAEQGYVAFAADMYGDGQSTSDPAIAMKMAGAVRGTPRMRQRVRAAYETLLNQEQVDRTRTAAIGFCFGGTSVLELAYSGAPVTGVVTFHAGIISPAAADYAGIKAKILVLHGADDPNNPIDSIAAFQQAMRKSGVDWQMIYYGNTVHSFTNPAAGSDNSKGVAYSPVSAARAWGAMAQFLQELFGQKTMMKPASPAAKPATM